MEIAARRFTALTKGVDGERKHPAHPLAMKIIFRTETRGCVRGELVFGGGEVELIVVHAAAPLEPVAGFAFIGDEAVETRAQISLEAGFAGVIVREVILFESAGEEALRQIFGVFVISVPFETDVFVSGFPVAREDGVEGTMADSLIVAAGVDDGGVICAGKSMCWSANIGIRVHDYKIYRINRMISLIMQIPSSCLRLSLDDHERDVIGGARPLRKLRQRRLNPIAYPRSRRLDVARDDFIQARRAKLFTARALRLGHTIGIDDEHISRLQLRPSFAILSITLDPERQTTRRKLF